MARAKKSIDKVEVDEIIALKLKDLKGYKKKLNYNSVWEFNKKIANNTEYKRSNGELFNLYGYTFWASGYKGEDYYGKKKIDDVKKPKDIALAGEIFEVEVQDILTTIDKYCHDKDELKKKMIKIFKKDRMKIELLKDQYEDVRKKMDNKAEELRVFEEGFATLFYNSNSINNSLDDVMSMSKSKDSIVYDELKNMFNKDESRIGKILEKNKHNSRITDNCTIEETVISLEERAKMRKQLEEDGF